MLRQRELCKGCSITGWKFCVQTYLYPEIIKKLKKDFTYANVKLATYVPVEGDASPSSPPLYPPLVMMSKFSDLL